MASRTLLTVAWVLLLVQTGLTAGAKPSAVTVREERGVYTVSARFLVDQLPAVAMDVLTDYERIPRFMPDVRTSVVRERGDGWAVVEQEAVSNIMMFSKRVHLLLDIDEAADALAFRDTSHKSFSTYEGAWRVSREDGRTAISYDLTAAPSFDVPAFLLKRLLRRDSGEMIAGLMREIAARDGVRLALHTSK